MPKNTGVVIVLVRNDGKVLLQLRDKTDKKFPNQWCFPGGRKENDESHMETAIREAREEYGISLRPSDCSLVTTYSVDSLAENIHVFVCTIGGQQPIMREGADMKWVAMDEVEKIELGFQQKKFFPKLLMHLRDFKK